MHQIQEVIRLCDFIPSDNLTMQVLNCYDIILNESARIKNYHHGHKSQLFSWESEVREFQYVYQCDRDEAMIRVVLSHLIRMDISQFRMNRLDYRKAPFTLSSWHPGMTYEAQQRLFDKTFGYR